MNTNDNNPERVHERDLLVHVLDLTCGTRHGGKYWTCPTCQQASVAVNDVKGNFSIKWRCTSTTCRVMGDVHDLTKILHPTEGLPQRRVRLDALRLTMSASPEAKSEAKSESEAPVFSPKKNNGDQGGPSQREDPLVGLWFREYEEGRSPSHWLGRVVAKLEAGHYLIQEYNWTTLVPEDMKVVALTEMSDWAFFPGTEGLSHEQLVRQRR